MKRKISVIIPAYNEEDNIPLLAERLYKVFELQQVYKLETIFLNDGSQDTSLDVLKMLSIQYKNFYYLDFSRNFGHQNALRAGYDHATGDAIICMDADMQHPPEMIMELVKEWENGYDVVLCKRKNTEQHLGTLKKASSKGFYQALSFLTDIEIEPSAADFRLIDRKVADIIKTLPEKDIFFRGLIAWMGFKQTVIEYDQDARVHGETKYSFRKMVGLAFSGLTSFSVKPLHTAIYLGITISLLSLLYIPYAFLSYFSGHAISGWASLIVTVSFFGGLQLLILGVMGLYLGKLFMQSKHRPEYIVRETNMKFD